MDSEKETNKTEDMNEGTEIDYRDRVNHRAIKIFLLVLFIAVLIIPVFVVLNLLKGKMPYNLF